MDSDVESTFEESDAYSPEVKPKAKKPAAKKTAAPKAPAAKKLAQTTLTGAKAAGKKRPKPDSEDEDDFLGSDKDDGILDNTPPNAKKQKKAPVKKAAGKPLAEIENDSMQIDSVAPSKKTGAAKTATEMYQKLTQLEHILKRPDTYIGSVERSEQKMWVFNKATGLMENRQISFVPGLYKIFDEILVNAADNSQRDSSMTFLKVSINRESGEISVENNGKGIPVEIHGTEKCYVPELIFGHLLAGSNFDDNEKKTVGGRNGYGAKLTNIFSREFTLECQDSVNGKRYKQTWTDNMSKMSTPKITSNKAADFVRITFRPDFSKFGMADGIDDDLEALLYRRVYDMAGTVSGIKVWLNGEHLKLNFKTYCGLYAKAIAKERDEVADGEDVTPATVIFEQQRSEGKLWEVGFTVSDGSFQQVSFVNNIATTSGGSHVNYIADQIIEVLMKELQKKKGKGHGLKTANVKNQFFIFINCLIDNPAFSSQTKEQLTTKPAKFGSKCQLGDQFLKKVRQSEAIDNLLSFADKKRDKDLAKNDGSKRKRISNDKLIEANYAGGKYSQECTLILTEGDSARGLAVAGRAILDPNRIGVFPLRGKMLNVRDASADQILKNKEVENIKKFLGLKHGKVYTDTKDLRYGHLMIMADQDLDGSHIKGLLINFFECQFPSLLRIPNFFQEFITPVVKVWQGPNPRKPQKLQGFFTLPQYEEWKESHKNELRRWKYKYLKGLGSSTTDDAQIYFTNLTKHLKEFDVMTREESEMFELAFSKKKADARKEWLAKCEPGTYLDHSTEKISYTDFVNRELILFSMADNIRSIPSMVDGLKPGQRKVLFGCFKQNLIHDQKVVELAGYVSKEAAYHHGEQSLQQTIVGLAQNFVGSNNINCLEPSGNFGSRLSGGSDAASARYIHTRLSPLARKIFHPLDEPNLEFQFDDGKLIEPKVYAPILPMVLVNGADGIGTGWSTSIPNYHPLDVVENLKRRMGRDSSGDGEEKPFEPMTPWFRGWKGTPESDGPNRFKFNGIVEVNPQNPNEVDVTELPIRMWTDDFKSKLEEIIRGDKGPSWIKDYKEYNDHQTVHFIIALEEKQMSSALRDGLVEKFKLTKTVATTNLVAFDTRGKIHKYENPQEIMEEYYHYRLNLYGERKKHWLKVYHADYRKLQNQYRFISEIIENKLIVSKKKKSVLVQELRERKYEAFPPKSDGRNVKSPDEELGAAENEDEEDAVGGARDYDYLLSMPIWSLTFERLDKLKQQIAAKKAEYDELDALSEKDLWCRDLDAFTAEWEEQLRLEDEVRKEIRQKGRRVSYKGGAVSRLKKPRAAKDDEDFDPGAKKPRAKAAPKAETVKTQQRFLEKFSGLAKPKPKSSPFTDGAFDLSDDDFDLLNKKAPAAAKKKDEESEPVSTIASVRAKRTTVARPKKYALSDDESDDDFLDIAKATTASEKTSASASASTAASVASVARSEKPAAKPAGRAAAAKKPIVLDEDSESELDDFIDDESEEEVIPKPTTKRAAATKKPAPLDDEDSDVEFQDAPEDPIPPTPKPDAKKAAAKKPIVLDDSDEDMMVSEAEEPAPAAKPATKRAAAPNKSPVLDDLESDADDMIMSEAEKPAPTNPRKRAAAAKAKSLFQVDEEDSESEASDDDDMLLDVGSLVKGIGAPAATSEGPRLSLFSMNRREGESSGIGLPKVKSRALHTKAFLDNDSQDDTNYEALAMSSPRKQSKTGEVEEGSDDDAIGNKVNPAPVAAKKRGRPAATKTKATDDEAAAPKPKPKVTAKKGETASAVPPKLKTLVHLSPAAKAYAKKNQKAKKLTSDDEDDLDGDDVVMKDPAPAPARSRPGRAAAARKPIVIDSVSEDDDDSFGDIGVSSKVKKGGKKGADDAFDMEDSD
ncbi:DNA topoisomerase [Copromyces sp. CBS 386.78]|nr:DNA topoisomerase [Copromyces sp. CBS 386.78]